jgi:signal transduction histidine kinase
MRLAEFIRQNQAKIGVAWDQFARKLTSFAQGLDLPSLRDDLDAILQAIANDIESPAAAKSPAEANENDAAPRALDQIVAKHAQMRVSQGFNLRHVAAEYRALRASVLNLYAENEAANPEMGDILRFDDAIDQALAEILRHHEESITQYTTRFLAILAHDLRNPLHTLGLAGTSLEHQGVQAGTVGRIKRCVQQANRLVDDLAVFVRSRLANALPLTKSATDLRELCQQVLEDACESHGDRSFNLTVEGNVSGSWDSVRLVQALSNLIGNAAVHGTERDIEVKIHEEDHSWVIVQVTSQGNPIPPGKLASIFEPLVQMDEKSSASLSSLGLGLFIAREIVTAHGGTIDVDSSLEDGTTFTIRLPR